MESDDEQCDLPALHVLQVRDRLVGSQKNRKAGLLRLTQQNAVCEVFPASRSHMLADITIQQRSKIPVEIVVDQDQSQLASSKPRVSRARLCCQEITASADSRDTFGQP